MLLPVRVKESFLLTTTGARFYLAADAQHRSIYHRHDIQDEIYAPAAGFEAVGTQKISKGENHVALSSFNRFPIAQDLKADLAVEDNGKPSKLQMLFKLNFAVKTVGNVLFSVDLDLTCRYGYLGKFMRLIPRTSSTAVSLGAPMMVYIFDNNRNFDFDRSVRYWFLMAVKTLDPEIVFSYEIDIDPQISSGERNTIDVNLVCTAIEGMLQYLSLGES